VKPWVNAIAAMLMLVPAVLAYRFPLYKFFDGVAFVDVSNVYPRLADFKPIDLRASSGFGLRIRTPYVVVRVDYGFNLSPRPDEKRGKFFFSIGQAF
jgi:outer membrane protein insertion porin family